MDSQVRTFRHDIEVGVCVQETLEVVAEFVVCGDGGRVCVLHAARQEHRGRVYQVEKGAKVDTVEAF